MLRGLRRRSLFGLGLAALGGVLAYRGSTGNCSFYRTLGIDTARGSRSDVDVEASVTINKPSDELYRFWRNFENLPRFMRHLKSVTVAGDTRSHWVVKAPAGTTVEWDAEIIEERANELLAWRSLPGADVASAGEVTFKAAPGNRGTVVRVRVQYAPPLGALGSALAKLFGEEPSQQIADDLRRFKQLMETGEIATTEGQPRGARAMLGQALSPRS